MSEWMMEKLRKSNETLAAENERLRAEIERLADVRQWIAGRRERIATAALQGVLANPHNSQWEPQEFFEAAVYYADGLIAELNKGERKP